MQICDFCRIHILESGSTWGRHQAYEVYKSSKHEACVFCTRILGILDNEKWQSLLTGRNLLGAGRSVYPWTLRKAARISEMPNTFVIIFREIPSRVGEGPETLVGLPHLTFYMLREKGLQGLTLCLIPIVTMLTMLQMSLTFLT